MERTPGLSLRELRSRSSAAAKDVLPPILARQLKRWVRTRSPTYPTFESAAAACERDGFQSADIVRVVVEKNARFRAAIQQGATLDAAALRTLSAVGLARRKQRLNVIDFGGGGGLHHAIAVRALGDADAIDWRVVETPAMVREARRLEVPGLRFFNDLEEALARMEEVDLVLASGSLQYCPEPLRWLQSLADIGAACMFITRTPFSDAGGQVVSRQVSWLSANGPGPLPGGFEDRLVSYPVTFMDRAAAERILSKRHDIRIRLAEDKGAYEVGGNPVDMSGYFCVRRGPPGSPAPLSDAT